MPRFEWDGSAPKAKTALSTSDTATTITCDDLTGWPTGASFPFVVTLERGMPLEEKVLCSSRSGNVLTVQAVNGTYPSGGRGWDTTVARTHASGVAIEHTLDAYTIDQMSRFYGLLTTIGDIFTFDGTNVVRLAKGAEEDVLTTLTTLPNKVGWVSGLIPIASSPPTVVNGRRYYDTTYHALMVAESGAWRPAARGTFAFATTAARDAFFGASGPTGQLAITTDTMTLWVGTGSSWRQMPNDDNVILRFTDAAARDAYLTSPHDGQVVFLTGTAVHWKWRASDSAWYKVFPKITTSTLPPTNPQDGDIWLEPTG